MKDLWQLLSPIGRRVSIETLEGKTLAIDASIWITQFIKAMRDEDGKMLKNAHLIGTIKRVLKLLFHRIRPLFVFDGATPMLKLRMVQLRRKGHDKQVNMHTGHMILLLFSASVTICLVISISFSCDWLGRKQTSGCSKVVSFANPTADTQERSPATRTESNFSCNSGK